MIDKQQTLFIIDSSNTHLNPGTIRSLKKRSMIIAVVPKGYTSYMQVLDVLTPQYSKTHYHDCAEEYIEKTGGRSKLMLTASQSGVCMHRTLEQTGNPGSVIPGFGCSRIRSFPGSVVPGFGYSRVQLFPRSINFVNENLHF
jgi:hypothetical protein